MFIFITLAFPLTFIFSFRFAKFNQLDMVIYKVKHDIETIENIVSWHTYLMHNFFPSCNIMATVVPALKVFQK